MPQQGPAKPKAKAQAPDTVRIKRALARDEPILRDLKRMRRAYADSGNMRMTGSVDYVVKRFEHGMAAQRDTLDMVRRNAPKSKKALTNHAAHGETVAFTPSARTRAQRKWGY